MCIVHMILGVGMLVLVITIGVDFPISGMQYVVVGAATACMVVAHAWIYSIHMSMGAGSLVLDKIVITIGVIP